MTIAIIHKAPILYQIGTMHFYHFISFSFPQHYKVGVMLSILQLRLPSLRKSN